MAKERLDVLLVKRNLAESREKAKAYIMAGNVFVDGVREDKAGSSFEESVQIEVKGLSMKYVSRGGFKLLVLPPEALQIVCFKTVRLRCLPST